MADQLERLRDIRDVDAETERSQRRRRDGLTLDRSDSLTAELVDGVADRQAAFAPDSIDCRANVRGKVDSRTPRLTLASPMRCWEAIDPRRPRLGRVYRATADCLRR